MNPGFELLPILSVIVDDDIEETFSPDRCGRLRKVLFHRPGWADMQAVDATIFDNLCEIGALEHEPVTLHNLRQVTASVRQADKRLACSAAMSTTLDQEMAAIMKATRMRLVFLFNTFGGSVDSEKKLIDYAKVVKKNHGEVWAFGRENVVSAGAMVFMASDPRRRFLTEDSKLLFHLSTNARYNKKRTCSVESMRIERASEIDALRNLFRINTVRQPHHGDYLINQLEIANARALLGDDVELALSAKEAEHLLFIRRRSLRSFRKKIHDFLGGADEARSLLRGRVSRPVRTFLAE